MEQADLKKCGVDIFFFPRADCVTSKLDIHILHKMKERGLSVFTENCCGRQLNLINKISRKETKMDHKAILIFCLLNAPQGTA